MQLYPNLTNQDGSGDGGTTTEGGLESIREIESELDELTEGTASEAIGDSDDEIRGDRERTEGEEEDDDDDENEDIDVETNPLNDEIIVPDKKEQTQEDIDFEMAFEKMSTDSYQERIKDAIKPTNKDIPVPMMAKSGKKTYDQLQGGETQPINTSVPFVLMLRGSKGGKQQFKTFDAPSDSQLAVNLKMQELKIKEENEKVKRLTLNITERIEEEDYQESLLQQQSQKSPNFNRYPKQNKPQKYKHQKGAPDADLIFG